MNGIQWLGDSVGGPAEKSFWIERLWRWDSQVVDALGHRVGVWKVVDQKDYEWVRQEPACPWPMFDEIQEPFPPYYYADKWYWKDGSWHKECCSTNWQAPGCY